MWAATVQVAFEFRSPVLLWLSGESGSLVIVDCSDLVSDLRRRLESDEEIQSVLAALGYGVEAEVEEFVRRLLILLTDALEETMVTEFHNGLSTSPQQAKYHSQFLSLW
jgi:hypothetical protein